MTIKAKTILTLDTETPGLQDCVYDFGFVIHNKKGEAVFSYQALVDEIFTNPKKMTKAHFAKKVFTHYAGMLDRQEIRLLPWMQILRDFREVLADFDVDIISAYNLGFDLRALKRTNEKLGDGLPMCTSALDLIDVWQFACETILNSATYKHIARDLGWVSEAGNIRTSAEMAFRFTSDNFGFIEDHTALSDALIESQILADCFATKQKIPYGIYDKMPWRIVNAK